MVQQSHDHLHTRGHDEAHDTTARGYRTAERMQRRADRNGTWRGRWAGRGRKPAGNHAIDFGISGVGAEGPRDTAPGHRAIPQVPGRDGRRMVHEDHAVHDQSGWWDGIPLRKHCAHRRGRERRRTRAASLRAGEERPAAPGGRGIHHPVHPARSRCRTPRTLRTRVPAERRIPAVGTARMGMEAQPERHVRQLEPDRIVQVHNRRTGDGAQLMSGR